MPSDLTAVSLFAGIGGFDLALRRSGVRVAASVEIDPAARGILRRHFPESKIFNDVREVTGDQLRAAGFVPGRGVLCFGWPCQGNSVAGRRQGMADPRSGLWRQVVRIVAETRPRWLVGENVPGLLSVNGGRDFGAVLGDLDELGYGVAWRILDAQFFGVPQRRRRVFVVGCLGDQAGPVEVLLEPEGGQRDSAAGGQARPRAASATHGGDGSTGVVGALTTGGLTDYDDNTAQAGQLIAHAITAREAKGADSDATSGFIIASTLQGGGRRGHRVDAEGAAGGHLIAATLTAGNAAADGVRPPGRPAEDDVNLIAFDAAQITHPENRVNPQPGDPNPPLVATGLPMIATTIRSHPRPTSAGPGTVIPVALRGRENGSQAECGQPGDPAFTVRTPGGGSSYPMIAHTLTSGGFDASEDGTGRGTPLVATPMAFNPQTGGSKGRIGYGETPTALQANQVTGVQVESAVRRLAPIECERLQGFPDDWTRWLDDGTEQSDSARYRQCGNAVAVPVAEWVARRVVAMDQAREVRGAA